MQHDQAAGFLKDKKYLNDLKSKVTQQSVEAKQDPEVTKNKSTLSLIENLDLLTT